MAQVVVLENQSLFDLSTQECGSIEAAFDIADLNGLAITDALVPGMLLDVPKVVNKPVADYYFRNNLKPATGIFTGGDDDGGGKYVDDGIDFMAIENDNIVM